MTTVQCPRCGVSLDLDLVDREKWSVAYGGVCTTPLNHGGRCGTGLQLVVTAHVFTFES
ncbi:MAG: hypothetical protein ACT4OP_12925 [Actinomycetota bacterium]